MTKEMTTYATNEIRDMATAAAKSGFFACAETPEAAMALMLLCQAEGLHPMQAMRRYHIIEGQPSMRADAMLAGFQANGGKVTWGPCSDASVSATFQAPNVGGSLTIVWTIEDAKRAGLAGRGNWAKYPRQMLRARVISEGVRATMPGTVMGIYTPGELDPDAEIDRGVSDSVVVEAEASSAGGVISSAPSRASSNQIDQITAGLFSLMPPLSPSEEHKKLSIEKWRSYLSWASGRTGASSRDLTFDEAAKVIEKLNAGELPEVGQ